MTATLPRLSRRKRERFCCRRIGTSAPPGCSKARNPSRSLPKCALTRLTKNGQIAGYRRFQWVRVTFSLPIGAGEARAVGGSGADRRIPRALNEQKAAHGRGLLDLLNGDCPERSHSVLGNRYPAARRLSAEDLPERRSATIS